MDTLRWILLKAGAGGKFERSCKSISNFGEFRYVGERFLSASTVMCEGGATCNFDEGGALPDGGDA